MSHAARANGGNRAYVYAEAPLRVYWELTRACGLACRHCRADALRSRDPRELTLAEGRRLLGALRESGGEGPRVVLTGGDPLERPDFWHLLEHGRALGLRMSVAPSGTMSLAPAVIRQLATAGAEAMSLSLDGPDAARHDAFRGVPGSFDQTVTAAHVAVETGIPLQVNTLVSAETLEDLPAIATLVGAIGAARWSLFFLIPVGRGLVLGQISPQRCEQLLEWLTAHAREAPYVATTTEAPHYRRVVLQRSREAPPGAAPAAHPGMRHGFGVRDGNGVMFVSHTGEVQPSGFLPLVAGQVRSEHPLEIYRESRLFRELREPDRFGDRCGRCEFRYVCGGSRARAYAASGDPLDDDPLCPYQPAATADAREGVPCSSRPR